MRSPSVRALVLLATLFTSAAPAAAADPFKNLFNLPLVDAVERAPHLDPGSLDCDSSGAPGNCGSLLFEPLQQPPAPPPPQPEHTGLAALVYTTASDFKAFPRRRSTWVILGIGAGAAALSHPADDYVNEHIVGSRAVGRVFAPGKWIGATYVQAGTAVGLYVVGRYVLPRGTGETKTNKVSHLGFDLLRAVIVSQALTQGIKIAVRRDRPTGECCSFPSGHASSTFATASVLERHFGYRGAWPTFVIASYVAASRLHDNRHFLSDVLFGSALGVASGWTVVGRHGRKDFSYMPVPTRGGIAVAFAWTPDVVVDSR